MKKLFAVAAIATGAFCAAAQAGDESPCAKQYSFEDQVILEWAALGGDPHAQMALAQCAFPDDSKELTRPQRIYAIKWTTLAACEAEATPAHDRRDIRTRKLKEEATLSFRRFGGLAENEKLNWRERDFVKFRKQQYGRLDRRREELMRVVDEADLAAAREELAEQFSRFGAIGLLRLAELSSCSGFGASPEFQAAAWAATHEAWRAAANDGVYASPESKDYDLEAVASEKHAGLSDREKLAASEERAWLMRTDPQRIAMLEARVEAAENDAALTALAQFTVPRREANGGLFDAPVAAEPSLTAALQFALESLGHVNFLNGPDNDYGPTTREAVARFHAASGRERTTTITDRETRDAICAAASVKQDPVSLYHVALMYQHGWGFPQSDEKAAAAIRQSENAMISALGGGDLPEWKREAYQTYAGKIRAASVALKKPNTGDGRICE